jgi:protocatechuate 3,4-dioxygenase beta subunit
VKDPRFDTDGQRFLRGHHLTDTNGQAVFRTIYPGWYPRRAVHIHFKIRTPPSGARAAEFTSQVYFDDGFSDRIFAAAPYRKEGEGRIRNPADRIFRRGGDQLLVAPRPVADGYEATFAVGLQLG